jgi:hypothetical protein
MFSGLLSTKLMSQKDGRVKVMAEILCGIRVIKFHVWEDHFVEKIGSEYDTTVHINFTFLQSIYRKLKRPITKQGRRHD